jgi:type II secretory pathway pseudopilin PulG
MLNNKARSFVTIMVVVALSALLLRLAIHRIIAYKIKQNQLLAQVNLKLLSTAMENYAKDNKNTYPVNIDLLTKNKPVYLERDYLAASSIRGYEYDCQRLEATGYSCTAFPVNCQLTGKTVYTVSTGGLIMTQACDSRE